MGTRLMADMDTLRKGTHHRGSPTLLPGRILLLHSMGTLSPVATHRTVAIPQSATLATGLATEDTVDTWAMEVAMAVADMVLGTTTEATAMGTMAPATTTEAMDTTATGTTMAGMATGTMDMDITTTASMGMASSRGASDVRVRFDCASTLYIPRLRRSCMYLL